jgi:uncharacterized membrane protein (DUF485 family)
MPNPPPPDAPPPVEADSRLLSSLLRHQAALSIRVAAVFLVLVFGVPLATHYAPGWTQQPVLGFPLSWFLLGLLFYPITWALSAYFVRASERLESEEAAAMRAEGRGR